MFLGLRTVIYPSPDLAAAKAWWTEVLGFGPYFDEPFFVGFNVEGYELGLDPNGNPADGPTTFWGVADIDAAAATMLERGATLRNPITDVGDSIRLASFGDPTGNTVGLIENPHFVAAPPTDHAGPGR